MYPKLTTLIESFLQSSFLDPSTKLGCTFKPSRLKLGKLQWLPAINSLTILNEWYDYDWDDLLSRFGYGQREKYREVIVFGSRNNGSNSLNPYVGD